MSLLAALADPDGAREAHRLAATLLPGRIAAADRVVALGWATVDSERAIAEARTAPIAEARAEPFEQEPAPFEPADRETLLGASARLARCDGVAVLVLEPDTEGRLAAYLARHGEGLCAAYVEEVGLSGNLRMTPTGRAGRLRPHDRPWGPFLIAVAGPGV